MQGVEGEKQYFEVESLYLDLVVPRCLSYGPVFPRTIC